MAKLTESESTREQQILDAAARVFTQKGYDAASMLDIANVVGLSKATLYHYFPSKEEILFQISIHTLKGLIAFTEQATRTGTAKERFVAFMEAHARFFEENYEHFSTMLLGIGALSPERRRATVELRDRHERNLRSIICAGVETGEFRSVDPVVAARAALSMLNWMIRWFSPQGPLRAHEIARTYADLLLRGIQLR